MGFCGGNDVRGIDDSLLFFFLLLVLLFCGGFNGMVSGVSDECRRC